MVSHQMSGLRHEFAVVRRLYVRLGIPEKTEIEFFNGGHQINSGQNIPIPSQASELVTNLKGR